MSSPAIPPAFQGCAYSQGERGMLINSWEITTPARKQSFSPYAPKGESRTRPKLGTRVHRVRTGQGFGKMGLTQGAWTPSGDWGLHPEKTFISACLG